VTKLTLQTEENMALSGTLLGTWERSGRRAQTRLVIWGILGLIFLFLYAASNFTSGLDPVMCIVFGVLFVVDARRAFFRPEKTFSLYTDGFIARDKEGKDLYVYRWNDVLDARWPNTTPTTTGQSSGSGGLGSAILGIVFEL